MACQLVRAPTRLPRARPLWHRRRRRAADVRLSRTTAALTAQALQGTSIEKHPERILVVVELSGGNDGLNTVVPYGDPAYYRARPHLGIPEREVIKVSDGFGFHPSMVGFERLYKDGQMAVVHGCGYDHPASRISRR